MAVSNVQNNTQTTTSTTAASTRNTSEMGKDQFLQLLVTQLKYQNPLEPMDDKEFVAQMAQFSSLEQMQNMNTTFSSMKAFNLMGKTVSASIKDDETGEVNVVNGLVEKVKIESGKSYVQVNGEDIPVDNITDITNSSSAQITDLMPLIGKNVNASITDETTKVEASGQVGGVKKVSGVDCAVINNVELYDVDVALPEGTIEYKEDYLEENIGKEVTIMAKGANGNEIEVTGTLADYYVTDGKINVLLDGINVPVNNISGILE